jgi:hypothetical protein
MNVVLGFATAVDLFGTSSETSRQNLIDHIPGKLIWTMEDSFGGRLRLQKVSTGTSGENRDAGIESGMHY